MAQQKITPWADINGDQPQAMSSVFSAPSTDTRPGLVKMPQVQGAPDMQAPAAPKVTYAPSPMQHAMDQDYQQLNKMRWQQANPWGTPENHPGFGGKLAHVFSKIGNIAGDALIPNVMARIPGTDLNRQVEEQNLTNRIGKEETEKGENAYRGAETAKTEAQTAAAPEEQAEKKALTEAQIGNFASEAEERKAKAANGPDLSQAYAHAVNQAIAAGKDPSQDPIVQHLADSITSIQKQAAAGRPDTPEQQYIDEYQKLHKGATVGQAERAYALDTQKPPQIAPVMVMVPNAQGGATAESIRPGQTVAPGATTMSQFGSQNTPTTQQRNVAAQASLVHEQMPDLINEINQNKNLMGPVAGRWNEFMQGKVGADNPAMAGLRSDLLMMSSAVALMHARGRLPENLRQEFDHAINAPQQTPENLVTALQHIDKWTAANMHLMQEGGRAQGQTATPEMIRAIDPNGKVHEAPKGTALPKGWKAQ